MTLPPSEEQELINRAQNGDDLAYESLILTYSTALFRVVRRLADDDQEAEEIVQEAFWRAWRYLQQPGVFQNDRPFFPFLVKVAVNLQRDRWRTEIRHGDLELDDDGEQIFDDLPAPEKKLEDAEEIKVLAEAVDHLPKVYRAVIELRYKMDMSYEEIAKILEMPVNTVRTQLRRAKQVLKEVMEAKNG
jgi:RNA polymerase sigma-70 factor, ECF subfamily